MAFVPVAAGLTRLGRDSQVSTLAPWVAYSTASSPSSPSCLAAGVSRLHLLPSEHHVQICNAILF